MFESAIGTALAFIFLFSYVGFKKVAGYAWIVDIALFALLLYLFKGTYAGMMTGMIAGLILSMFLKVFRSTVGYEKLRLVRYEGNLMPQLAWIDVRPGGAT